MIKLNLGCGRNPLAGYWNVDLIRYEGVDYGDEIFFQEDVFDFLARNFHDDVIEIRADQFLEHLRLEQGLRFLRKARRVLSPGGRLRLTLPDWAAHVADYVDHLQRVPLRDMSMAEGIFRPEINVLVRIVFDWGHQMIYDEEMLRTVLDMTGWQDAVITHPDGANLLVEAIAAGRDAGAPREPR